MIGKSGKERAPAGSKTNVDLHLDEMELRVGELMRQVLPYAGRRNDAILLFFLSFFFSSLFSSFLFFPLRLLALRCWCGKQQNEDDHGS